MEEVRKKARTARDASSPGYAVGRKIAQLEHIEISDKDVQERVDALAHAAGERAKTLREDYARAEARDDLRAQMVFDRTLEYLLERANVKEIDPPISKVDEAG